MADRKISDLTALTTPATGDLIPIVDVSEAAAADKNKSITVQELFKGVPDGTAAAPGLAFESDDGNGIFLAGTDQVGVATGGVERVEFGASEVVFNDGGADYDFRIEGDTNTALFFVDASADRVGVGTTSPNAKLDVESASDQTVLRLRNDGGNNTRLLFSNKAAGLGEIFYQGDFRFVDDENSDTERLRIDSSGRVGIGTSSPAGRLEIKDNGYRQGIVLERGGSTADRGFIYIGDGTNSTVADEIYLDAYNTAFHFRQGSTGTTETVTFKSDGKVGIGTTSPSSSLHISDASTVQARLISSAGSTGILFSDAATTDSVTIGTVGDELRFRTDQGAYTFRTNNGAGEAVRIDSSGRLLVGTSTARAIVGFTPHLQTEGTTADDSALALIRNTNGTGHPRLLFGKSRGTALGSNTVVQSGDSLGEIAFAGADGTDLASRGASIEAQVDGTPGANDMPGRLVFSTTADGASSPTERMRVNSDGGIAGGGNASTNNLYSNQGFAFSVTSSGFNGFSLNKGATDWGTALYIHRTFAAGDGALIEFAHDTVTEGNISISGTTVSYNGGHLSRWSQTVDATEAALLLKGTVMTNLDEMCEWIKEDGSLEDNEQLNKMAISSAEGDPNVAGVLVSIDEDGDLNVGMTGDMIIRIAQGVTVERGDLLMSAGDGTAKPQDDDIIRSKTIAKVTSTNVSCTYDDGSYCVPCVLMAC